MEWWRTEKGCWNITKVFPSQHPSSARPLCCCLRAQKISLSPSILCRRKPQCSSSAHQVAANRHTQPRAHRVPQKEQNEISPRQLSVWSVRRQTLYPHIQNKHHRHLMKSFFSTTFGNKRWHLKRLFKGIVRSEMKSLSSFLHSHVGPNHSVEHKSDAIDDVAFLKRIKWEWKVARTKRFWKHHESIIKVVQTNRQFLSLKSLFSQNLVLTEQWSTFNVWKRAARINKISPFVSHIRQNVGFKTKG